MSNDWKEIDLDEILNFEDAHTGQMARYERIMRQREIEALTNVHESMKVLEEKLEASTQTQSKFQKITVALTFVIAAATVMKNPAAS